MTLSRVRAVSLVLRASLLALLFAAAATAYAFPAHAAPGGAFPAGPGGVGEADDLGLGIGPVYSADEPLFTIFYNATSYGEMQPCPT